MKKLDQELTPAIESAAADAAAAQITQDNVVAALQSPVSAENITTLRGALADAAVALNPYSTPI